jgi:hypothetical protein
LWWKWAVCLFLRPIFSLQQHLPEREFLSFDNENEVLGKKESIVFKERFFLPKRVLHFHEKRFILWPGISTIERKQMPGLNLFSRKDLWNEDINCQHENLPLGTNNLISFWLLEGKMLTVNDSTFLVFSFEDGILVDYHRPHKRTKTLGGDS